MKSVKITLSGCDDRTTFNLEVTDEELDILKRVSIMSEKESSYGCMPIMKVSLN